MTVAAAIAIPSSNNKHTIRMDSKKEVLGMSSIPSDASQSGDANVSFYTHNDNINYNHNTTTMYYYY